ncbi:uncharacterized protein LOC112523516 [Cynara cardunculus var. scolymus]|uniref:DUF4408 domain-containing protein n=1 Tax=Cynara cardunculus var. scolymus TaxID=59895 RepID=A0A103XTW0_CYNCS|nr:uncharacterized protein LOC112523516 [Cynara cardunculus var. scolymus]KVH96816.1 protein of unknown function DUF4408 [Cynara cardunculus var. scolymus]
MASSSSSNSWILSLKVLLVSVGVVSTAMAMKLAVPLMLNFAVYDLPVIWYVVVSWLKPPYLYVVINGIIITIAASSRFQHNRHQENQSQQQVDPPNALSPSDLTSGLPPVTIHPSFGCVEHPTVAYDSEPSVMVEPPVVYESKRGVMDVETVAVSGSEVVRGVEDEFVVSRSSWNPPQNIINSPPPPKKVQSEFILTVKEKQLVTSRFAHHRKPTKTSPEGARALRVLKPKKHETMESTWKMITDGRHMPLTRHLRKSDTFGNVHRDNQSDDSPAAAKTKVVKKSETFKDRINYENENQYPHPSSRNSSPASGGKLRKEGSMSHDELNRRVEAFIKKFNDDMRLQRQESLNQYMEMVNRGPH